MTTKKQVEKKIELLRDMERKAKARGELAIELGMKIRHLEAAVKYWVEGKSEYLLLW